MNGQQLQHQRYPHNPPPHHRDRDLDGMANSAYSPEIKPPRGFSYGYGSQPPPSYRESVNQGIPPATSTAYAFSSDPPEFRGHQHHDLASAYPALHNKNNRDSYSHPNPYPYTRQISTTAIPSPSTVDYNYPY